MQTTKTQAAIAILRQALEDEHGTDAKLDFDAWLVRAAIPHDPPPPVATVPTDHQGGECIVDPAYAGCIWLLSRMAQEDARSQIDPDWKPDLDGICDLHEWTSTLQDDVLRAAHYEDGQ